MSIKQILLLFGLHVCFFNFDYNTHTKKDILINVSVVSILGQCCWNTNILQNIFFGFFNFDIRVNDDNIFNTFFIK